MPDDAPEGDLDRKQTDESLRAERHNADQSIQARQARAQETADEVIQHARDTADAVLESARDKADDLAPATSKHSITELRAKEDAILRTERAAADVTLEREREETVRALARLLPMEREKTDRFLLTERGRSDDDVSNRDDFLGIVSHDLRNLLSGIVMSATLMSDQATQSDEGKRSLLSAERIQRYAARMNRLIGDLVDVAAIDAGKLSIATSRGDISTVIDEAIDMFQGLAHAKGITLTRDAPGSPMAASFDHDRLIQILANLITNAIKFTQKGGEIVVHNERATEGLLISVRDNGIGIPSDKLESVFEKFWQVGRADRRGVGLGLYISKYLVEAHGGRIWAESIVDQGSVFSFTLT